MTTDTQLMSSPSETAGLQSKPTDADGSSMGDAVAPIDERTSRRGVSAELAPPGHYLAIAAGDRTLLVSLLAKMWPTRIGRGFAADVRIADQRVSRRHATITARRGAVRVEDDQSANGTFVNGRRVIAAELSDGDEIVLGATRMRYVAVS
jgi:hypothetical protein